MLKKRMLTVLAVLLSCAFLFTGCKQNVGTPEDNAVPEEGENADGTEEDGTFVFGFTGIDMENPYFITLEKAIREVIEENEYQLVTKDPASDPETQAAQIQEMIDAQVDLVFLCPVDPEQITGSLEALKEADIPVINLDVRVDEQDLTDAFIGSDDENAGKVCGENLTERKPDGGKLVIVESPQNAAVNARITGFEEKIRNKGFEVVRRIDAGGTETGVQAEMAAVLAEDPQIDAVMCGDDRMALQVLQALSDAGRSDILVYSVGGSPEVKSAMADPESPMAGVGAQSPINMGKTAVKTAVSLLDGGAYEEEVSVETFFINRDNLEMYGTDGWQ